MLAISTAERQEKTVVRAGGVGRRFDYIGSPGTIDDRPQAFLVDRLYPGARIDPHFHDIDQFQIVVDGFCTMGKKPAPPVTFQYADAYTPYGPIVGEEVGFAFFTLRPIASGGFFAMPGNRHNMPCRAGRNIAGRLDLSRSTLAAGESTLEDLMDHQADGVNAMGLRLGAGATGQGDPSDAGGQYHLVCAGDVVFDGKAMPARSLAYVEPGEPVPVYQAGETGAEVLILQFARPSVRPGSDPAALKSRDPEKYMTVPEGSGLTVTRSSWTQRLRETWVRRHRRRLRRPAPG